jgi:hypothetical protein
MEGVGVYPPRREGTNVRNGMKRKGIEGIFHGETTGLQRDDDGSCNGNGEERVEEGIYPPRCFCKRVRKDMNAKELSNALVQKSEQSPSKLGVKVRKQLKGKKFTFASFAPRLPLLGKPSSG